MLLSLRKSWISSPKFDLSFIVLPPLLGLIAGVIIASDNPVFRAIEVQLVVILVIIDLAHLISMWFRIYTSGTETKKDIRFYWLIYVGLIFIFYAIGYFRHFNKVFYFITYFAIFHNIKQNYGFYSIYRKDETKNPKHIKFEKYFFNAVLYYPLIVWHMDIKSFDNYWSVYFVDLSSVKFMFYPLTAVLLAGFGYYLKLSIEKYKNNDLSPTKLLFFFTVTAGWYGVMLVAKETIALFLAIISAHAIAYLFFVWKLYHLQIKKSVENISKKVVLKKNLFFISFVLIFGYIARGFVETALQKNGLTGFWGRDFWHSLGQGNNSLFLVFLFTFPFATQVSHFIIDGFIWKQNRKRS